MSVVPQGKAIQAMYREYREGNLLVNRKYQRKLVWTLSEKRALIDSILKGYPIPLILFAERPDVHGSGKYEIIDGIQRLNAVFAFVEQAFDLNGHFFDVNQFATAKQHADNGVFQIKDGVPLLPPQDCSRLLDYQLAATIYPAKEESEITDVFGRINSGGRQLSRQEQRQAGVTSQFSSLVRSVAAELRGDVSQDVLVLSQMPEISVETGREPHGYGIRAEDTLWCRQGILSVRQLKQSEDEQLIADIAASIVLGQPLGVSRERLDTLYDQSGTEGQDLERRAIAYGIERLWREIKYTFSVIKHVVEQVSGDRNYLRSTVRPGEAGRYPIKAPLYAIFMAFFDLLVKEERTPDDPAGIMAALRGLAGRLQKGAHYERTENRVRNIDLTKGLIQGHFVKRVPPVFGHGPSLLLDFENALRRSRIESARYEFKQGILRLDEGREKDPLLLSRLIETACGMANLGPECEGHIFIGVADKASDAAKIRELDKITPHQLGDHYIVGVDREATVLRISLEQYVQYLVGAFQQSQLTDPLKTHVLGGFDTIVVYGMTVVRVVIPKQTSMSFVGERAFSREGSSTVELTGQQLAAAVRRFPS
jgi:hypothetical protein